MWLHGDRDLFGFVTRKGEWIFGFGRYVKTSNAGKCSWNLIRNTGKVAFALNCT